MCIHPLHLAEIWLFGHDEEPERALFVYTPLGIVKHKASELGTDRNEEWCLTLQFSFRGGLSWCRNPPALRASTFDKGGLRGICPPWRLPSERAAGEETGNHFQTETLPNEDGGSGKCHAAPSAQTGR